MISGDWYFGYGREFSEPALKHLPPGSFYTEPPGIDHFAMTKATGVVIQISGTGPSGTTYVDPKNDPANKIAHRGIRATWNRVFGWSRRS